MTQRIIKFVFYFPVFLLRRCFVKIGSISAFCRNACSFDIVVLSVLLVMCTNQNIKLALGNSLNSVQFSQQTHTPCLLTCSLIVIYLTVFISFLFCFSLLICGESTTWRLIQLTRDLLSLFYWNKVWFLVNHVTHNKYSCYGCAIWYVYILNNNNNNDRLHSW